MKGHNATLNHLREPCRKIRRYLIVIMQPVDENQLDPFRKTSRNRVGAIDVGHDDLLNARHPEVALKFVKGRTVASGLTALDHTGMRIHGVDLQPTAGPRPVAQPNRGLSLPRSDFHNGTAPSAFPGQTIEQPAFGMFEPAIHAVHLSLDIF